ncbi:MAG: TetR/AcrR family transcriptional regulator [Methylacidiphilales bacterium]|nr:TetR/AcrR family transcriptional regulator [Candidatus Methylacidiphilales bacterium]
MSKRVYPSAREKILDAAEDVVLEQGAIHLTLDSVAKASKLSKGGLLYHFPSKAALLEALMRRIVNLWVSRVEAHAATLPPGPCRKARAIYNSYFSNVPESRRRRQRLFVALAAAKTHQPSLMDIPRQTYAGFLKEFEEEGENVGSSLVMLTALDGIWWSHIFGTYALNPMQEQALKRELQKLLGLPASANRANPRASKKTSKAKLQTA